MESPIGVSAPSAEDLLRAGTYSLLAALLRAVPQQALLEQLRAIGVDRSPPEDALARAWRDLRRAAETAEPTALDDEFHRLFIGLGRGELLPYGSWYRGSTLMDRPLSELRRDLAELGFTRQEQVREPEDHVSALCEVMALMITDDAVPWTEQQRFFATHLGNWFDAFWNDCEQAAAVDFYRAVARLGRAFTALERHYLAMPA